MKCIPKNELLLSNPPKYKCKNCGQVWSTEKPTPECLNKMDDTLKEKFLKLRKDETMKQGAHEGFNHLQAIQWNKALSVAWEFIEANTIPKVGTKEAHVHEVVSASSPGGQHGTGVKLYESCKCGASRIRNMDNLEDVVEWKEKDAEDIEDILNLEFIDGQEGLIRKVFDGVYEKIKIKDIKEVIRYYFIPKVDDPRKLAEMIPVEGLSNEKPLTGDFEVRFKEFFRANQDISRKQIREFMEANTIPKDKVREIVEKAVNKGYEKGFNKGAQFKEDMENRAGFDNTKDSEYELEVVEAILKEFNLDS